MLVVDPASGLTSWFPVFRVILRECMKTYSCIYQLSTANVLPWYNYFVTPGRCINNTSLVTLCIWLSPYQALNFSFHQSSSECCFVTFICGRMPRVLTYTIIYQFIIQAYRQQLIWIFGRQYIGFQSIIRVFRLKKQVFADIQYSLI